MDRRHIQRRQDRRREADRTILSCKRRGDHFIFAGIVLLLFFGLDILFHFHPAAKGIELVLAATVHRLFFGGGH